MGEFGKTHASRWGFRRQKCQNCAREHNVKQIAQAESKLLYCSSCRTKKPVVAFTKTQQNSNAKTNKLCSECAAQVDKEMWCSNTQQANKRRHENAQQEVFVCSYCKKRNVQASDLGDILRSNHKRYGTK
eukprot:407878-Karenia_brevis.AAC.2